MKFKPYPKYKASGVRWLGDVPNHWTASSLRRLVEIQNGSDHKHIEQDEGYPVIGSGGPFAYASRYMYDGESVLLGRKGTIDKPLYVNGPFWTVDTMYWTKIRPGVSGRYAYYSSLTIPFSFYSTNTALPSMTKGNLESHPVCSPSLSEQAVIANFLDRETAKLDTLIAKQERLIDLLQEKRQAMISHAVTKGLPLHGRGWSKTGGGTNSEVPMKDSGIEWLGMVPEHWRLARLKFLAKVQTGVAKGKDYSGLITTEVPYLRVANVQDGYLDLAEISTIEISQNDLPRYILKAGDVLMNEGGDFDKLGRGHVWYGEIEPCIHQNHVFAVRPTSISPEWLNAVTGSGYAQFYFMTRSKQSTNLASISSTNIMELPVVVPSKSEQAEILKFIANETSKLDLLTDKSRRNIDLMREHRTALISAAVTGKIDVREAA